MSDSGESALIVATGEPLGFACQVAYLVVTQRTYRTSQSENCGRERSPTRTADTLRPGKEQVDTRRETTFQAADQWALCTDEAGYGWRRASYSGNFSAANVPRPGTVYA